MQTEQDITKIAGFLSMVGPAIIDSLELIFRDAGLNVQKKGSGLDTSFHIKVGEMEHVLCLHNLLLEVATIDRDETSLRFDEKLLDFSYFLIKLSNIVNGRLNILFTLLEHKGDIEKAVESIAATSANYERIRIIMIDPTKPN